MSGTLNMVEQGPDRIDSNISSSATFIKTGMKKGAYRLKSLKLCKRNCLSDNDHTFKMRTTRVKRLHE